MAAQGASARVYLDALPERAALLARIKELSAGQPVLSSFQVVSDRFFYLRRDPSDQVAKLVLRRGLDGVEEVLCDPNTVGGVVHTALNWYVPSPDGARVAYGISQGGSEDSTLHVLEVGGTVLDVAISRVRFGAVAWIDEQSFLYNRLRALPADAPPTERHLDSRVYRYTLGDDPEASRQLFGRDVTPAVTIAHEDLPIVGLPHGNDWALGFVGHFVLSEMTLYATPRAALLEDHVTCPWRKVCDVPDGVTGFAVHEDTIYLMTHKDAPRCRVLATSLAMPDLATAREVVPHGDSVIEQIAVAGGALLLKELDAGSARVRRVSLTTGRIEPVPLPFAGTIYATVTDPTSDTVLVPMESWTISPRVYAFNAAGNLGATPLRDTGWQPPSSADFSTIKMQDVEARSTDGTPIPLSLVYKNDLRRDGTNPTLLEGYGSYGFPIPPHFRPQFLAWLERGGVWAIGHLRGGGERGKEWHEAGRKLTKGNTIADFIACAEYLIAEGYTRPACLAGEGTSAGGIPSGGALVRRPELWTAMIMRVALTNMVRNEVTEIGLVSVPEFGSVTTEEGFRGLRIIDSYGRVQDGVAYPAVLLTTGLNDARVAVWQASKMTARLQAATTSGKPVLLRVEEQGGHGIGSTRDQGDAELADIFAFLFQHCGGTRS